MDRTDLLALWNRHHNENTWITAWSGAVAGLTPPQAAWSPQPGRHSIWQIVHHVCFWREYHVSRTRSGATLPEAEIARLNWLAPESVTDAAWAATAERFGTSHAAIAAAIADATFPIEKLPFILTHDCYHVGQIMQLRAMQGMKPIE
jgi:uncharacterized damage-inducible protein DinB